jgi:hypothetical protein
MATPEDDLNELAQDISTAIEKARELNLSTSASILSMALVEISEALKAAADEKQEEDDPARQCFAPGKNVRPGIESIVSIPSKSGL